MYHDGPSRRGPRRLEGLEVTMSVAADESEPEESVPATERRCPVADDVENETGLTVALEVR